MPYTKPVRVWCACGNSADKAVDREAPEQWQPPVLGVFHACSVSCRNKRAAELAR